MRSAICRLMRSNGTSCDRLIRLPVRAQIAVLSTISRAYRARVPRVFGPVALSRRFDKSTTEQRGSLAVGGGLHGLLGLRLGPVPGLANFDHHFAVRLLCDHFAFVRACVFGDPELGR